MVNKNKTIFAFLLVFTLVFSLGLTSAYGDTGLMIYNDDITNIDESSAEVETTIYWDSNYPELKMHLEYR